MSARVRHGLSWLDGPDGRGGGKARRFFGLPSAEAALCVQQRVRPRALDASALRRVLIEQGAYLGHEHEVPRWNQGGAPLASGLKAMSYRGGGEA